jgi:hypothetical protein
MHVDGVKKLVDMRGGINAVRQTSPLTARMVSWYVSSSLLSNFHLTDIRVSMLVMGHPQFNTQDDHGIGDGIPIVPEWQMDLTSGCSSPPLDPSLLIDELDIDPPVKNVLLRLRAAFDRARNTPFQSTRLHDLTCFVIHRLLLSAPHSTTQTQPQMRTSLATEAIRYAIILYMFIIHGPTYYSHAVIMDAIVGRFIASFTALDLDGAHHTPDAYSLDIWSTAIGLVASAGTPSYTWFLRRAQSLINCPVSYSGLQGFQTWDDVLVHIRSILWMETPQAEGIFRPHWDALLAASSPTATSICGGRMSPEMSWVSAPPLCLADTNIPAAVAATVSPRNLSLSLSLVMQGDMEARG